MDSFDPQNRAHVERLKKLTEVNTEDKFKMLRNNPMKCDFLETEMVQVLFGLCAQYATAVFKKKAIILD